MEPQSGWIPLGKSGQSRAGRELRTRALRVVVEWTEPAPGQFSSFSLGPLIPDPLRHGKKHVKPCTPTTVCASRMLPFPRANQETETVQGSRHHPLSGWQRKKGVTDQIQARELKPRNKPGHKEGAWRPELVSPWEQEQENHLSCSTPQTPGSISWCTYGPDFLMNKEEGTTTHLTLRELFYPFPAEPLYEPLCCSQTGPTIYQDL